MVLYLLDIWFRKELPFFSYEDDFSTAVFTFKAASISVFNSFIAVRIVSTLSFGFLSQNHSSFQFQYRPTRKVENTGLGGSEGCLCSTIDDNDHRWWFIGTKSEINLTRAGEQNVPHLELTCILEITLTIIKVKYK